MRHAMLRVWVPEWSVSISWNGKERGNHGVLFGPGLCLGEIAAIGAQHKLAPVRTRARRKLPTCDISVCQL